MNYFTSVLAKEVVLAYEDLNHRGFSSNVDRPVEKDIHLSKED